MPTNLSWKHVFRIWLFALPIMAGLLVVVYHKDPKPFMRAHRLEQQALKTVNQHIQSFQGASASTPQPRY